MSKSSARSTRLVRYRTGSASLLGAIMLLGAIAAAPAEAVTWFDVRVTDPDPLHVLYPGDQFTLDIRLTASTDTISLGASAWGYPLSSVRFVSGEAVESINHETCFVGVGCFSGLDNSVPDLVEEEMSPGIGRVRFFQGLNASATNTNPLDPGLDGVIGGHDAQVRLTFVIVGVSSFVLNIGSGAPGDGEILAGGVVTSSDTPLQVSIIPEPAIATLLGLGLALLSATGAHRPD